MKKIPIFSKQLSFAQLFLSVVAIASLRVLLEWMLFVFPVQLDVTQDYIRFYLENVYYFLNVFLIASFVISRITRTGLRDFMNLGVRVYLFILLPPVIDRLLGKTDGYLYCSPQNLWVNFATLSLKGDGTPGIFIEILLAIVSVCAYVWYKTRNVLKAAGTAFFLDALLLFMSTPGLFMGPGKGDYVNDVFLPVFYVLPFAVILFLVGCAQSREKCLAVFSNMRLVRSLVFVFLVACGARYILFVTHALYLVDVILTACALFLVWEVSVTFNDVADLAIDRISNRQRPLVRGILHPGEYRLVALIESFIALSCAAMVNLAVLALVVAALALAWMYSVKPLRLRNMLLGNAVIGLATLVSFLAGIFASTGYERALRAVSQDRAVLLCLFIFLMGTLISTAKDIKDIEGDAACGVKNLFTVFGKKKAKIAVTALVFLVFNIPNLYVWNAYAYVLSLVAAALYFMFENIVIVYVAAMLCTGLVLEGVLSVKDKKCSSCSGRSGHKRRVVIEEIRKKRQEPQPVERKRIIRK